MRSLTLLSLVLALAAFPSLALAASGTWGVFADNACAISLYSSTFQSGVCGAQSSGSKTIYYITTCTGNSWTEIEYSDAACTTVVPNTTNSNESGVCFASGQYWGQVICPSAVEASTDDFSSPLDVESLVEQSFESENAASSTSAAPLAILAMIAAAFMAIKA